MANWKLLFRAYSSPYERNLEQKKKQLKETVMTFDYKKEVVFLTSSKLSSLHLIPLIQI